MKLACFTGSSLREIAVGLRCSTCPGGATERSARTEVWYSMPHFSCDPHPPTARVVRGSVSAIQAFSLSCCATVSPAGASSMAEARQTLDPVFPIELIPSPDRVVVEQQHRATD